MDETSDPLIIEGPKQSLVNPELADAGLPPAVGVRSYQVFRASSSVPELTDKKGWTYHHHVDMACWKGRLYVGWNSCERDEDVWPSRELYSTSLDGAEWTEPAEIFPQGVSVCLRMYYFHAPNGRMLVIAGLRVDIADTDEDLKGGLVVREIFADHKLGEVFTLRRAGSNPRKRPPSPGTPGEGRGEGPSLDAEGNPIAPTSIPSGREGNSVATAPFSRVSPPMFDISSDAGFVEACRQLLADRVYLEQQDRGRLLGERRMKWHDASAWPGGVVPGDNAKWVCGKAFSFFRREEKIVGICKMGWVTISSDNGNTWSLPVVPPTLVTGKAKVWAQRTADGRFALVYNPSRQNRFPLIVVTSDDGIHFRDMRIVQGELPIQRYEGKFRSIGPQYIRGISTWSDDGSRNDQAMWLVYSMSKEDIWVSRVPLPIRADETRDVIAGWNDVNLYQPKWAQAKVDGNVLKLVSRDPYDYASATRVFGERKKVNVHFTVTPAASERGNLFVDLFSKFGTARPIRLELEGGKYEIVADASRGRFSVTKNGKPMLSDQLFVEPAESLHRIVFRTGEFRGIGGKHPVTPGSDRPQPPVAFAICDLRIKA